MEHPKHTCPACGYYMFAVLGDNDICSICGWENDTLDLQEMYRPVGPNHVSLEEAQKIFAEKGPRKPVEGFERDTKWRPLDREKDKPRKLDESLNTKIEDQYYWYWN